MKMHKGLVLLVCTSLIWSSIQIPVYAESTAIENVETEQVTVSGQEIEDYSVWAEFQDEIDQEEPCDSTEIDVEASYSASAAINYAKSHMSSGHSSSSSCPNGWLCAEFVSKCLQQGGLGNATKTGCRGLFNELKTKGTAYTLSVESDGRIKVTGANAGKISPGDVIITYCKSHDLYLHAVLVSGSDSNGYVLNYAHNSNKKNAVLYESRYCTKKGGNESYSNVTAYVIHFPQPSSTTTVIYPTITNVTFNNVTNSGFRVTNTVQCSVPIKGVMALVYSPQTKTTKFLHVDYDTFSSANYYTYTYSVDVNIGDFNYEEGDYRVQLGAFANGQSVGKTQDYYVHIERKAPTITDVKVSDVTSSGYTVSCRVTDDSDIIRVQFPTWTNANGQDDLLGDWTTNHRVSGTRSGDIYSFRVNTTEHNNEIGNYTTHIYAFDRYNNMQCAGAPIVNVPKKTTTTNSNTTTNTTSTNANKNNGTNSLKNVQSFVERMYTVALGRKAEKQGLNDWTNQLTSHQIDGAGIANGFINSPEFIKRNLNNNDYVITLYKTFFDRSPDASGKTYWLNQLSNGASREQVLCGFVNSKEFTNLCNKYGITRGTMQSSAQITGRDNVQTYVLRLYTKALNRNGEARGVEDWTNRINTGTLSAENVAKSFFSSQEFMNRNLSNSAYVETLYQTFMDRPSDAGGKQYWIDKLNSGISREQVLEGFSRSAEFSEIMSRYGL